MEPDASVEIETPAGYLLGVLPPEIAIWVCSFLVISAAIWFYVGVELGSESRPLTSRLLDRGFLESFYERTLRRSLNWLDRYLAPPEMRDPSDPGFRHRLHPAPRLELEGL